MTQDTAPLPVIAPVKPRWYARKWVVAALALVLFVSGAMVGGAGMLAIVVNRARSAAKHPDEAHRKVLERMVGKLNLSPAQHERVQGVLTKRQAAMRTMRSDFQPRVRKELEVTAKEIQAELNPDQAKRWRGMVDHLKSNWMPEGERE